ncbi:MAG: tetratricopeptide repeat protein [Bacteroidia bacterium]|nr:tetratricopeptide repeat protein [Bacteroidia bacterium]
MKKHILSILLFILVNNLFCQQAKIDSLNAFIAKPTSDTALVNAWLDLDDLIYLSDPVLDEELNTKILNFSKQKLKTEKEKLFIQFYKSRQLVAINNLGIINMYRSDNEAAKNYYAQAVTLAKELGNKQKIAAAYNNLGVLHYRLGNYSLAIEYYTQGLSMMESSGDMKGVAASLNNIGNIYKEIGDTIKALRMFEKGLDTGRKSGAKNWVSVSLSSIAELFSDLGKTDSVELLFNESLQIDRELGNKQGIASNLANLSKLSLLKGNSEDAKIKADSALLLFKEVNDQRATGLTLIILGDYYKQKNDLNNAIASNKKALDMLMNIGQIQEAEKAANALFHIYKSKSDYKSALEAKELYDQLHDSLQNDRTTKAIIRQEFKYEYEKQTALDSIKHIAVLEKKDAELKSKKQVQLILVIGLVLILFFSGFIFNRFKVTAKQNAIIEKQKNEVEEQRKEAEANRIIAEEKNREILDSINYAKRIQTSLMPTEKYIERVINKLKKKA